MLGDFARCKGHVPSSVRAMLRERAPIRVLLLPSWSLGSGRAPDAARVDAARNWPCGPWLRCELLKGLVRAGIGFLSDLDCVLRRLRSAPLLNHGPQEVPHGFFLAPVVRVVLTDAVLPRRHRLLDRLGEVLLLRGGLLSVHRLRGARRALLGKSPRIPVARHLCSRVERQTLPLNLFVQGLAGA